MRVQVVVGVVYNPILDELYTAVRGKGAYLNGEPIHVSDCKDLGSALIITEIGVTRDDVTLGALFGRISGLVKGVCNHCFQAVMHALAVVLSRHCATNLYIISKCTVKQLHM